MTASENMNLIDTEKRIEELETKISFQDFSIDELNQALIQQQDDINKLKRIIEGLVSQVEKIGDASDSGAQIEMPPHY